MKKSLVMLGLGILVLAIMFWLTGFDVSVLFNLEIPWYYYLLWATITIIEFMIQAIRLKELLPKDNQLDLITIAKNYNIGQLVSFLSPSRSIGEAARMLAFGRLFNTNNGTASSIIFIERITDLLVLTLLLNLAFFHIYPKLGIALSITLITGIILFSSRRIGKRIQSVIPFRSLKKLYSEYLLHSQDIMRNPKRYSKVIVLTLAVWGLAFLRFWNILNTLGINLNYLTSAGVGALSYLSIVISIFPGGIGFFEGTGTTLITKMGYAPSLTLLAITIERIYAYWLWIFTGIILSRDKIEGFLQEFKEKTASRDQK